MTPFFINSFSTVRFFFPSPPSSRCNSQLSVFFDSGIRNPVYRFSFHVFSPVFSVKNEV